MCLQYVKAGCGMRGHANVLAVCEKDVVRGHAMCLQLVKCACSMFKGCGEGAC